jgi:hypothetical protein
MENPKYSNDPLLSGVVKWTMTTQKYSENELPKISELVEGYPSLMQEMGYNSSNLITQDYDVYTYIVFVDGMIETKPNLTNSFIASYMCDYVDFTSDAYEDSVKLIENRRQEYYRALKTPENAQV